MTQRQMVIFTLLYFLSRLIFYPLILRGEEGIFANIFLYYPPGPEYSQVGRLGGVTIYTLIEHPALIYEVLRHWGMLVNWLVDYSSWPDLWLTILARFSYSLFEYVVWLALIIAWRHLRRDTQPDSMPGEKYKVLLFYCLAVWPASLLNTTNINIDASVGVLTAGLFSVVIFLFSSPKLPSSGLYLLLFFASFFVGFGKNEISLVLLMAIGMCGICLYLGRILKINTVGSAGLLPVMVIAIVGNIAGNYFNYSFDPVNYIAGFNVIHVRSSQTGILGTGGVWIWVKMFLDRLPFIFIHLILWFLSAKRVIRDYNKVKFPALLSFLYGSALFFGYFISYAEVGSRYFEPALAVLMISFLLLHPQLDFSCQGRKWFGYFFILCALHSSAEIISTGVRVLNRPSLLQTRFEIPAEVKDTGCIPILEQADAFYRLDIDYVAYESLRPLVEAQGKKLCPISFTNR